MPPKARSCIVIGAGLAGLSAAHRLKQRGWDVTLIEAQQRVGGRVFSYRFNEARHLVCELGGEWIGKDHAAMRDLCRRFRLKLDRHLYSFSFWNGRKRSRIYLPGKMKFSPKAQRQFDSYGKYFAKLDSAQQRFLDQFDWWSVLGSLGFTPDDLVKRDLMDSTDFGESIRLTSAYTAAAEYFESNPTDEMDFKIRGGNDRLAYSLVSTLDPNRLYLQTKVRSIQQTSSGVKVFVEKWKGFAAQKNWAIPQARNEWVLIVDSDERVPASLAREIQYILEKPQFDGYWIRRRNFFMGREIRHGTWGTDKVLRLFRRDKARYQQKHVHAEIELDGNAGSCREKLDHYSYRTLDDFMRKAGRYSAWGAMNARDQGKQASGWRIFGHGTGHFLKSYVAKQGFRDGTPGLIIAFMEGFHAFLKYSKLWEAQRAPVTARPKESSVKRFES